MKANSRRSTDRQGASAMLPATRSSLALDFVAAAAKKGPTREVRQDAPRLPRQRRDRATLRVRREVSSSATHLPSVGRRWTCASRRGDAFHGFRKPLHFSGDAVHRHRLASGEGIGVPRRSRVSPSPRAAFCAAARNPVSANRCGRRCKRAFLMHTQIARHAFAADLANQPSGRRAQWQR